MKGQVRWETAGASGTTGVGVRAEVAGEAGEAGRASSATTRSSGSVVKATGSDGRF